MSHLSLVPQQIPALLAPYSISAAGRDGNNGGYGGTPSAGQTAGNVAVRLHYDPSKPDDIQVASGRHRPIELSPQQTLQLNAFGGRGGDGGIGFNGQDGYDGADGINATQYSSGTNGQNGGDGGDAGPGTDGAAGGHGGVVSVTLAEKDLDLCLAVNWNVNGGAGGAAGAHGIPGRGGAGGRGGSSYSWTEYDTVYFRDNDGNEYPQTTSRHYSNPGGHDGSPGRNGRAPSFPLWAGPHGHVGSASFNVERDGRVVTPFLGRYHLVVKSFEVYDENHDGINEPGEYLIVKNIIVRNEGLMPSPSGNRIKIVIRQSQWLQPETTTPIVLPNSIPIGQEIMVPGQLKALVRHEQSPRGSGQQLLANDTIRLLAYSERLKRAVPEFSGGVPIVIQYPLKLASPAFVDCMTKADEMTMSWIVENISCRGYGRTSDTRRRAETQLVDMTSTFVLENPSDLARKRSGDTVTNDIDDCGPTKERSFSESFTVSSDTRAFSTGTFRLELCLSDPHRPDVMREIVNYELNIQISEAYEYSQDSQFLLVVNASTKNEAILEMKRLILSGLHLGVDIFNISLTGSFMDRESEQNILTQYAGKSIIISGNRFTFFGSSPRYNWDLIDPQEVLYLSMNDTGFLFCEVIDQAARADLAKWTSMLCFPVGASPKNSAAVVEHKNRRALIQSLNQKPGIRQRSTDLMDQFPLSKNYPALRRMFQGSTNKRLKKGGNTLAKDLNRRLPMHRFAVMTTKLPAEIIEPAEDDTQSIQSPIEEPPKKVKKGRRRKKRSTGVITVAEGLSRTASCMISHSPIIDSLNTITPQQTAMMMSCLPFSRLSIIFWNIIQSVGPDGLSAEAFYQRLPTFVPPTDSSGGYYDEEDTGMVIGNNICVAVAWAVQRALDSDVQQLCAAPYSRMSDSIKERNAILHTNRIDQFYGALQDGTITASETGVELAVQVLSSLNAALKCRSPVVEFFRAIPGHGRRRPKLRDAVSKHKKRVLLFMAPPDKMRKLEKQIAKATKQQHQELRKDRKSPRVQQNHLHQRLAPLEHKAYSGYTDVAAMLQGAAYLDPTAVEEHMTRHRNLLDLQRNDALHAQETRKAMISKIYSTMTYIPLTEFQ